MTTVSPSWITRHAPDASIQTSPPIRIAGVGSTDNLSTKFVQLTFSFPGRTRQGQNVVAQLTIEVHILDTYTGPPLIGMDVIKPEGILIDPVRNIATIASCDMIRLPIQVTPRKSVPHKAIARVAHEVVLPPQHVALLPIAPLKISKACDYMLDATSGRHPDLQFFDAVLNHATTLIPVLNRSDHPIRLPARQRLVSVIPHTADAISTTEHFVTAHSLISPQQMRDAFAAHLNPEPPAESPPTPPDTDPPLATGDPIPCPPEPPPRFQPPVDGTERRTTAGVTVFGDDERFNILRELLERYDVWHDSGETIDIPPERWMRVPLVENWREKLKTRAKGYPASPRDLNVIAEIFDRLHAQDRMEWSLHPTPFTFPVFVVWRSVMQNGKPVQKGRAVIDIRALNEVTQKDLYPLPSLEELLSLMLGKCFISVFDGSGWFHQWRVHPDDTHKFTIVSPRGQETMLVTPMGFKNSVSHVQRQIDHELRPHFAYARAYVDDTIVFSDTFEEHCTHLSAVLETYQRLRASLNPNKSYVGFPSISFLGKRVDGFGLSTPADKVAALAKLAFPKTLKELETYIGMTQWLRHFVPYYAYIIEPLHQRKIRLLQGAPTGGPSRKHYVNKTAISDPTPDELEAFQHLQQCFQAPTFLAHHEPDKPLFIETDASKQRGFGGFLYHATIPDTWPLDRPPPRNALKPILFLSKTLSTPESKLWPTELEMAAVVWTFKQAYRIIQANRGPVILYTDHSAIVQLYRQTTMHSSSTDRTNPKLARASEYLQRFEIQIYHRPGRQHVVPDALSRLPSRHTTPSSQDDLIFNLALLHPPPACVFHTTLVQMTPELRQRFITGYQEDTHWAPLYQQVLDEAAKPPDARATLPFTIDDSLLYTIDFGGGSRLVVPRSLIVTVIQQVHDLAAHPGIERTIDRLRSVCIHRVRHHVLNYIRHCSSCQQNKPGHHKPYGSLQPILSAPIPFHTITIDFVTALPPTPSGLDSLLTITDKYTKRIGLVPGATTWSGLEWGKVLVTFLLTADWGIPVAIISDRDSIFLSQIWQEIFRGFNTSLLTSTAYHPQTDGQSERTNMTAEIALRHAIPALDVHSDWPCLLPFIQAALNSSRSSSTGSSPHELMYGVPVANPLTRLHQRLLRQPDLSERLRALDLANYAHMKAKLYYDRTHQDLNLPIGSKVFVRLHKGYKIKSKLPTKLQPQRIGPFTIIERVGRLAYKLDLPPSLRLHPVLSVAQLEPAPNDADPFERPSPPGPITIDGEEDHWEIERLLDKRVSRGKTQYLVKWKGWGDEHNVWYDEADLPNARDLIADYNRTTRPPLMSRLRRRT